MHHGGINIIEPYNIPGALHKGMVVYIQSMSTGGPPVDLPEQATFRGSA